MKILVTGATGVYGRSLVERLAREGHEVVAMARRRPTSLPAGVTFAQGDVAELEAVVAAMEGCEVVVHLAFVVSAIKDRDESRRISVGGTQNVVDAMKITGARRLVFASSIMSYGANPDNPPMFTELHEQRPSPDYVYGTDKLAAERVIIESGVEAVLARTMVTTGRNIDNLLLDIFAAPSVIGIKDADMRWQLVHQDDIGRFLALACVQGPPGPVNVGPSDFVPLPDIAKVLGKRYVAVSERSAIRAIEFMWDHDLTDISPGEAAGMSYLPKADTTRLREEWGFECAWSTADGLLDLRRAVTGRIAFANKRFDLPWKLRYPNQKPGEAVLDEPTSLPDSIARPGELDTPRPLTHPCFRAATNTRAPLPALTLATHSYLLRSAAVGALDAFGMSQEERERLGGIAAATFGHRLYVNDEVSSYLAKAPKSRRRLMSAVYGREVRSLTAWTADALKLAANPAGKTDAQLEVTLGALRDELAWFWAIAAAGAALNGEYLTGLDGMITMLPEGGLLSAAYPTPVPVSVPGSRNGQARGQAERSALAIADALLAAVRERAGRLVRAGMLANANDAAHLTWDELMAPPVDATEVIKRRRAEHKQLSRFTVPAEVTLTSAAGALTLAG